MSLKPTSYRALIAAQKCPKVNPKLLVLPEFSID